MKDTMLDRPITHDDLHKYVPNTGQLEYWRGIGPDKIEFKYKTQTEDGEHTAEFSCVINKVTSGPCRQKMLTCVQQAHDWKIAHEKLKTDSPVPA